VDRTKKCALRIAKWAPKQRKWAYAKALAMVLAKPRARAREKRCVREKACGMRGRVRESFGSWRRSTW